MKKILFVLIALAFVTQAQEMIKVTGDRVSLRAEPDTNAVLLGKAMRGDELLLKENNNPEWVGVQPPDPINLWVDGSFVSNNVVLPEILNIRSGPSLSHSLVGSAMKGDTLTERGEAGGWLKIAPTSNSVIWISRTYVDAPGMPVIVVDTVEKPIVVQELPPVVEVVTESTPREASPVVLAVVEPTVQEIMTEISSADEKTLIPDLSKAQGEMGTYTGILQPANGRLYQLADEYFTDIVVCYVRGNSAQMKTFSGMKLRIVGKTYWAEGMDLPMVIPVRIKPYATVPNK